MNENLEMLSIAGMHMNVSAPAGIAIPSVTLMLHGWTGNEDSMWVFANNLPASQQIISPRGLYPSNHPNLGGYSWTERHGKGWPKLEDFNPAVDRLTQMLHEFAQNSAADFSKVNLVGFSQGAALAYAFLLRYPQRVRRLAALAGFMPLGCEDLQVSLDNLPVFIAHGSQDETIPLEMAQKAAQYFMKTGAAVTFCRADVGHLMGADCFAGFKQFMA